MMVRGAGRVCGRSARGLARTQCTGDIPSVLCVLILDADWAIFKNFLLQAAMMQGDIPSLLCVLILDADGGRICCKYFSPDFALLSEQQAFEKKMFEKSSRTNAKSEGAHRAAPRHPLSPRAAAAPRRAAGLELTGLARIRPTCVTRAAK
ncbi:hypothetical protein T492DRAFT_896873 [Pavlovales sp. CCMP2436]|nr:hypothetical protein T492DRAFT_896873 [Pavlovales sp. CCMP2436]